MLPRLDAAVVTPLSPVDGAGAGAAVGEGRQTAFQRALQGMVGSTLSAEVISSVKDGSFIVKVADNAVRMMLPPGTQVGAEIPLTVLSANPRPTFQLANGAPGGSVAVVVAEGGQDGAAAPLPSQESPVYLPGARPPAAQPGQAGQAGTGAGAAAPDADAALPGQLKPGTTVNNPATPAAAQPGPQAAGDTTAGQPPRSAATAGAPAAPATPAAANPATPDATATPATPATSAPPPPPAGALPAPAPTEAAAGAATPASANATPPTANPPAAQAAAAGQAAAPGAAAAIAVADPALAIATGSAVPAEVVKPPSLAATLLGKAPLTPAAELPDLDPATPAATLSSTARALTSVLGTVQTGQAAQLALIGKTALFGNAAPDTAELAQKLHSTISQSGLFYESHVTEWAKGERALTDLMREPQMQRMAQAETAARAGANGPDLSAAQMINQQLHTQEQGRVQWNGQAWPGQAMQWEIRRDQREGRQGDGAADAEPEQVWRSGVRFRFPMLGTVSAAVTLVGDQVHIQVQAGSDDTAVTLRAYAGQLEAAMAAAGAPLSSLSIAQEARDDE